MQVKSSFARVALSPNAMVLSAALCGLAFAAPARAGNLILGITQTGAAPVTILDNGPGDLSSAPGTIVYQESGVGGVSLSLISGVSNSPGNLVNGTLNQSEVTIRNNTAGQITLTTTLTDNGFIAPVLNRALLSDLTATFQSAGANDSASLQSIANSTSTPLQTLTSSGTNTQSVPFSDVGAYSLKNVTSVTLSPGASVILSDSTSVTAVTPEPASLALLAFGGLGLLARRRRA